MKLQESTQGTKGDQVGKTLEFYSDKKDHGEFSNFYPAPIILDGIEWPTTEHYFQAQKAPENVQHRISILLDKDPMAAALKGRSVKGMRDDWDDIIEDDSKGFKGLRNKDAVMLTALRAKFTQHEELAWKLLDTGDLYLVEATSKDYYWGKGTDGTGANMLGQLLMRVREELRKAEQYDALEYMLRDSFQTLQAQLLERSARAAAVLIDHSAR